MQVLYLGPFHDAVLLCWLGSWLGCWGSAVCVNTEPESNWHAKSPAGLSDFNLCMVLPLVLHTAPDLTHRKALLSRYMVHYITNLLHCFLIDRFEDNGSIQVLCVSGFLRSLPGSMLSCAVCILIALPSPSSCRTTDDGYMYPT